MIVFDFFFQICVIFSDSQQLFRFLDQIFIKLNSFSDRFSEF